MVKLRSVFGFGLKYTAVNEASFFRCKSRTDLRSTDVSRSQLTTIKSDCRKMLKRIIIFKGENVGRGVFSEWTSGGSEVEGYYC